MTGVGERMGETGTGRVRSARLAFGIAGLLGLLALTGCSGDEQAAPPKPVESSTAAAPEFPQPIPAEDAGLAPGVRLTAPDTDLPAGQPAVVAWRPRDDFDAVARIRVTRQVRTVFGDNFADWQVGAGVRSSTPYFVQAQVTNLGADLGGRAVPLYGLDTAGNLIEPTRFEGTDFASCPGGGAFAEPFRRGTTQRVCLVFLVPSGERLTATSYRPGPDFAPITWFGKIGTVSGDPPQDRPPRDRPSRVRAD